MKSVLNVFFRHNGNIAIPKSSCQNDVTNIIIAHFHHNHRQVVIDRLEREPLAIAIGNEVTDAQIQLKELLDFSQLQECLPLLHKKGFIEYDERATYDK